MHEFTLNKYTVLYENHNDTLHNLKINNSYIKSINTCKVDSNTYIWYYEYVSDQPIKKYALINNKLHYINNY